MLYFMYSLKVKHINELNSTMQLPCSIRKVYFHTCDTSLQCAVVIPCLLHSHRHTNKHVGA